MKCLNIEYRITQITQRIKMLRMITSAPLHFIVMSYVITSRNIVHTQETNQVVLWDKIIVRGSPAVMRLRNQHTKYYFQDIGNGLKLVPYIQ